MANLCTKTQIKLPDSLKFKTLVKGREVYGGGIIPIILLLLIHPTLVLITKR